MCFYCTCLSDVSMICVLAYGDYHRQRMKKIKVQAFVIRLGQSDKYVLKKCDKFTTADKKRKKN